MPPPEYVQARLDPETQAELRRMAAERGTTAAKLGGLMIKDRIFLTKNALLRHPLSGIKITSSPLPDTDDPNGLENAFMVMDVLMGRLAKFKDTVQMIRMMDVAGINPDIAHELVEIYEVSDHRIHAAKEVGK